MLRYFIGIAKVLRRDPFRRCRYNKLRPQVASTLKAVPHLQPFDSLRLDVWPRYCRVVCSRLFDERGLLSAVLEDVLLSGCKGSTQEPEYQETPGAAE